MFEICRFQLVKIQLSWIALERAAKESDSLVHERLIKPIAFTPKYHGAREIPWESAQTIG